MSAQMISARAVQIDAIEIEFSAEGYTFHRRDVSLMGGASILSMRADGRNVRLTTSPLRLDQCYRVRIKGYGVLPVDPGPLLDPLYSDQPLGFVVENGRTTFRVFAPRAQRVTLVLFHQHDDETGAEHPMTRGGDGVWEIGVEGELWGRYYGYRVAGPDDPTEHFRPGEVVADPYAVAVASKNTYRHEAKSLILRTDDYDWEGDDFVRHAWSDLIIYELHVRDLTAHPSSGVRHKGTYRGLVEKQGPGGLHHILELGVNAVELLPCQEFGNLEPPYGVEVNGVRNTWNPYERNHWGYMTSYFFAPESYYASGRPLTPGGYCGACGQQVTEFRDMVKALHRAGMAVIMDVVYNHVSHYDLNPLKLIDKKYYFRLDARQAFLNRSGCGNDLKTERRMARRLIVDSVTHWMRTYHIDGFRFDLATLLDWETVEAVTEAARKINPDVILIAEPWGGGKYDLAGFSDRGWAAWNDLFRNGVKGQNPEDGRSWIFGTFWGGNDLAALQSYVRGSTRDCGGPFLRPEHSVNYLESHDDYTLGDFLRLGTGRVRPGEKIRTLRTHARLTKVEAKLHKLAMAFLFTSQGMVMLAEGQEFGRSKVIAPTDAPDPHVGEIDHNSYNKDNETNWLNYAHRELNRELFDYTRGLIALRRAHPAFRRTPGHEIRFLECATDYALGYILPNGASGDRGAFAVLFNPHPRRKARFQLPEGAWHTLVDETRAGPEPVGPVFQGDAIVAPRSLRILVR